MMGFTCLCLHNLICLEVKYSHNRFVCGRLGLCSEQSGGEGVAEEKWEQCVSVLSWPLLFEYSAWDMHLSFKNKYFLSVYGMSDCSRTLSVYRRTACDMTLMHITRGSRWEQRKDLEDSQERQTLHSNLCVV